MADTVQVGDKVSWNWNGNQPSGTVGEVKAGEVSVTSHRGNEIKKTGDESNPAVHIERSGNDVVKRASELNIEEKASGDSEKGKDEEKTEVENAKKEQNGDSQEKEDEARAGEKRKAEEKSDANGKEVLAEDTEAVKDDEKAVKRQKTSGEAEENEATTETDKEAADGTADEVKKGVGRPKSNGEKKPATKKEKKAPSVGKSERKTRSQGAV